MPSPSPQNGGSPQARPYARPVLQGTPATAQPATAHPGTAHQATMQAPTAQPNVAPAADRAHGIPQPALAGTDAAAQATTVVVQPAQLQANAPASPLAQPTTPAHHQPLAHQLAAPLFTLASAKPGEHVMTLRVSPEDLGPLTVRAHIDGAGVRIELFAAGDAGREAVRHVLPELRRGLEDAGASLSLSDRNSPQGNTQGNPTQDNPADAGPRHGSHTEAQPRRAAPVTDVAQDPGPVPPAHSTNQPSAASRLDILV
ncbi:flagellar hook-length control protein FliK [Paenarthrobacter sp. S56]|uniref:flagellar hook-length control protein FliK n=1 Tax=Paenarthrobacter sp. S56 TaxID=3138179 RepID=UPI00321B6F4A